MPTRRQLIQKITLNASSTSVSFSNIPGNYTDLKLVSSARTDRGNNGDSMYIRFNGDTAANYKNRSLYGTGGSGVTITITSPVGIALTQGACGNSDTANTFGNSEAYIPNYTASTAKSTTHRGTSETNAATSYMSLDFGLWTGTAAITSMTLVPGNGTNFLTGSTFYLYGITQVPIIRGGEVSIRDGFKYHTFRSSGSLQVIEPGDVEYLVVAGGGSGGGQYEGGGGGAGGLLTGKARLSPGVQTLTIGAGGAPAPAQTDGGNNGSNTSAIGLNAIGGGRGGRFSGFLGLSGGSGGGGGGPNGTGGSGTSGQGNSGGNAATQAGGGGGGASAAGSNATTNTGGAGGAGRSVFGITYAGGGGGAAQTTVGIGGSGGGGAGANYTIGALSGLANTGGGGGGIRENVGVTAGAGGSGIVIIRYPYDGN